MIAHWLLLLLLVPGWLLPAGVRVPLCACQFMPSDIGSCCSPVESRSCCASEDDTTTPEQSLQQGGECHCSVDVPTHEPARVQQQATISVPFALPQLVARLSLPASESNFDSRFRSDRPRGPSPGRPNPAPLRL